MCGCRLRPPLWGNVRRARIVTVKRLNVFRRKRGRCALYLNLLKVWSMRTISSVLGATALLLIVSTSVFGLPVKASSAPDPSFSVFFDPGAASLSKEAREIISAAAKRFAATHNLHAATRILVTSETDDRNSASLSNDRVKAVRNQLVRDGIERRFVSADEQPSAYVESVRLLEELDRRVSISIQENLVMGRL